MEHVLFRLLLIAGIAGSVFSCKLENQTEIDEKKIEQYLADNNLTATKHPSGMYYIIETPGTGGSPLLSSTITANYKGYFLDKQVFDQTTTKPLVYPLSELILGWQIAIPLLQRGGKGTFILPSQLAYGSNPPSGIPANAVLVFDLELIDFQ